MDRLFKNDLELFEPIDMESIDLQHISITTLLSDSNDQPSFTTLPFQPETTNITPSPASLNTSFSSPKMRTQLKQELWRNKTLQEESDEKNKEKVNKIRNSMPVSFCNQQMQQKQNQSLFNNTSSMVSKLENPTLYHCVAQEKQYRDAYNACTVGIGGSDPPMLGEGLFVEIGCTSSAPPNLQYQRDDSFYTATATPPFTNYSCLCSSSLANPEPELKIEHTVLDSQSESSDLVNGLEVLSIPSSTNKNRSEFQARVAKRERRRKDNHNAVERKRRDVISGCLKELKYLLPNEGDLYYEEVGQDRISKGKILKSVIRYIKILQDRNEKLHREFNIKDTENKDLRVIKKKYELKLIQNKIEFDKNSSWKQVTTESSLDFTNSPPKNYGDNLSIEMNEDLIQDKYYPMLSQPIANGDHLMDLMRSY